MQRLHLVDGLNQSQLAERLGRTRETMARVLKDEDFQALKHKITKELAEEARIALKSKVRAAVDDWVTASRIAAKKGDHTPAKDILMHTGVIRPPGEVPSQVFVRCLATIPTQEEMDAIPSSRALPGEVVNPTDDSD